MDLVKDWEGASMSVVDDAADKNQVAAKDIAAGAMGSRGIGAAPFGLAVHSPAEHSIDGETYDVELQLYGESGD